MLGQITGVIACIICGLMIVVAIRTVRFKRKRLKVLALRDIELNQEKVAGKLSEAIKIPTISHRDVSLIDFSQFLKYQEMLEEQFPLIHKHLEKTVINNYSLVYRYKGENSSLKPVALLAHIDVVPVEDGTEEDWSFDAFSGEINGGYVWGRGTLDTKVTMITALEAAEMLLKEGFVPQRDIYFAFGHDEEIRGSDGAVRIVDYFKEKGLFFDFVLDEGGIITTDSLKGIGDHLAVIGIAEKGVADIELSINSKGGHSAMPPMSTALGRLSQAIVNVEKNQMPLKMSKPVKSFIEEIGPSMGLLNKVILGNLWLFRPVFIRGFAKSVTGNALLRTTTAVTMAQASEAANVLPQVAKATINFRIAPGDTAKLIVGHINKVTKGLNVETRIIQSQEPSSISSTDGWGYETIKKVTCTVFEDTIAAPYLVMAATDSRYYEIISDNVYRFSPLVVNSQELSRIHNTNECVSLENLEKAVRFYHCLMREL